MGLNTTILVLNDALDQIENDPEFGRRLAKAIRERSLLARASKLPTKSYVRAGNHVNAVTVVDTHHADDTALIAVGGNHATVLFTARGYTRHHEKAEQWSLLETAYDQTTKAPEKSAS